MKPRQIAAVMIVMLCVFLLSMPAFAGGGAEKKAKEAGHGHTRSGHDEDSEGHGLEEILPHIEPVPLDEGERLRVVASTSIVGDVVSNVTGEAADLTVMMNPGQNPHSFRPAPSALAVVERAHIVFVNGFGLEEGLLEDIETVAQGYVVPVSAGIEPLSPTAILVDSTIEADAHDEDVHDDDHHDEEHTEYEGHDHGPTDPHVWFAPTNVMIWVENIRQVLSEADPANQETYRRNAEEYRERLEELDTEMRRRLLSVPAERRRLVSDHQLLTYTAAEYRLEIIGTLLPGTTTSTETSPRQLAEVIEVFHEHDLDTVFIGSTAGQGLRKLADSVSNELDRKIEIIPLLTGSLTEAGTPGDTYIGYMQYNLGKLIEGLTP